MTTIGASIGGTGAVAPGGMPEKWRAPGGGYGTRQAVDWNKPEYATPKPPPDTKFGRRTEPNVDVPQLPERNIRVRAKAPATYYTLEGTPIPADDWVTLPISPSIMAAIKEGDLERGEDPD